MGGDQGVVVRAVGGCYDERDFLVSLPLPPSVQGRGGGRGGEDGRTGEGKGASACVVWTGASE